MTRYREDFPFPVAFDEQEVREHARRGARRRRPAPAPRRRDREVRPRDVLLQRRRGERVGGRDAGSSFPRRATSPSYDLKPEMSAAEVAESTLRRDRRRVRVRGRELRESRHGRAHGLDPRGHRRRRGGRRGPRSRRRVRRRGGRRVPRDRRSRQRGANARAGRRQPAHRAHDESGAARRSRATASSCGRPVGCPISRPPSWGCSTSPIPGDMTGTPLATRP